MEFLKYKRLGAYHWKLYEKGNNLYAKHVDVVKDWVRKEGKTLDIGAGDGLITSLVGAVGIDNDVTAVNLAQKKGVNVGVGDGYNLGIFEDNKFHNVLMADVIEHLEHPEKCLKEIKRVLKNNGLLYITTPPLRENGKLHDKYHYKEYNKETLTKLLNDNFFVLVGEPFIKYERIYAVYSNTKI